MFFLSFIFKWYVNQKQQENDESAWNECHHTGAHWLESRDSHTYLITLKKLQFALFCPKLQLTAVFYISNVESNFVVLKYSSMFFYLKNNINIPNIN